MMYSDEICKRLMFASARFPQQTEDQTVCQILQLFWVWLRMSRCIRYLSLQSYDLMPR